MKMHLHLHAAHVCVTAARACRYRGDQDKQKAAMYRGAGLLESYQRQVQSLDGGLQELEENIDTVREVRSSGTEVLP